MDKTTKYKSASDGAIESLGSVIPAQLVEETEYAYTRLNEALCGDSAGFVANRQRHQSSLCGCTGYFRL